MARKHHSRKKRTTSFNLGSFLVQFGTKMLLGIIIIVVVLTLAQCTVKKPEAPTWETQLTVPLINRVYHMDELIRRLDQNGVDMVGDSIRYSISYDLDTVTLNADNLTTAALSCSFSKRLGSVNLTGPSVAPVTLAASNIPVLSLLIPGVVPPTGFQFSNDLPQISNFSSATVGSGTMYAVITNNLGVPLDAVGLQLYDIGNSGPIDLKAFTHTLQSGDRDSLPFDLSGKTISDRLRVTAICHTPGGTVLSSSGKEVVTELRFPGTLSVIAAVAQVPAMSRLDSQVVSLSQSDPIADATLSTGRLQFSITNSTNLDADVVVTIPQLTQGSVPTVISRNVPANAVTNVNLNLAGYHLVPEGATAPQTVSFSAAISVPGSGASQVAVDSADAFAVTAQIDSIQFSSVTGTFSSRGATITPLVQNISVPRGFESIQLAHAVMTLNIENHVNLPGTLDITVNGDNGKTLHVQGAISAGGLSTGVTSTITDTSVADFLSPLPSQITVSGTANFGDGVTQSTLHNGDFVFARVNFVAPLEMIIGQTPIETDIEKQNVSQDNIDAITNHVIEARFYYNVVNHLPIGAHMRMFLGPDSATLYTNPQLSIDSIFVKAAPVSGGIAIDTASTGYQAIILDSADIQVLRNPTLYIGQELVLDSSNGQAVRLMPTDSIGIVGRIEVNYRFDGKF
jgi:hypothetical protein